MSKEICISSTPHETRLAILEDDQLTEVYYERENEYTLAGSIYKGRVTRVLPGMQSAFVDLGLERDAFLYVTDFMEEQEDSSEFERIPANGEEAPRAQQARQPRSEEEPRRSGGGQSASRGDGPRGDGSRGDGSRGESAQAPQGEFEDGTRRWRGRRGRRKGFRPPQGGQPVTTQEVRNEVPPAPIEPELEPEIVEARPQVPFALPGESLSKYGMQIPAAASAPRAEGRPAPPKPNLVLTKPSTLIETPIEWDGQGLLPGESISRYRGAPHASAAASHADVAGAGTVDEEAELAQEEREIYTSAEDQPLEVSDPVDEIEETIVGQVSGGQVVEELVAEPFEAKLKAESHAEPAVSGKFDPETMGEFDPDEASASYRIDPSAPSEFRFPSFGASPVEEEVVAPVPVQETVVEEFLTEEVVFEEAEPASGGEFSDEHADEAVEAQSAPSVAAPESVAADTYLDDLEEELEDDAPGIGLVEEEEVTDEEEYDFSPIYVESEDHDLQDLEEETLDSETGVGSAIGEMVRDAHIDHRIDVDASGLVVEEEDEDDELETAEEEGGEEGQAAAAPGQPARRPRNDQRRGRGRSNDRRRHNGRRQSAQTSDLPIISELLKQGQEILVQIAKEPIAKKGARITSHIALPGRFLVFMPTVNHVGVSRKISSDEERQRLKRILISEKGTATGGFIVRTAADGASEDDLRADIRFLISLWTEIKQRSDAGKAPALIYHDLNLVERILRDQVSDNFSTIWVDTESEYERIVRFLNRFQPSLVRRVKLYTKETPLFEQFGIQDEISKALKSKVWLKSGGSIVINQTEALVAIDINTGKYVGKTARLEDTILKTNLDAIPEIVRQIRLRDLGGIIVIDFIDMDERKNRNKVMQALEEELKSDRAPSKVLQFNDFGLVAITRKRVKQSLERTLSTQCAICAGTGMVKSPTTVCNEIYVEMRKMQSHLERQDVLLRVHPEVVKTLKVNNARWLNELEEMSGKTIIVKSDPTLHPEQFDIH
jgi:Rne/Rng family ribonuclease